jgi:L-ascorbate metabolism protein UlaG (beta-lactamase superfamily)
MTLRHLSFLALVFALAGCFGGGGRQNSEPSAQQRLVRVDWYGYQCFRIKSTLGLSILTNPFAPGSTDFAEPKNVAPEVLLVTTEDPTANYIDLVDNTPHILRGSVGVGTNNASGIRIVGTPVFKNPDTQDVSGMNVIYSWSMDGLRFCFLGELNTMPAPQDISRIGRVDVLFVPVSSSDLTSSQRQQLITQLRPQVIIPMGALSAMSRFASGYTSVYRLNRPAALLSREALPAQPTVLLFPTP